MSAKRKPKAVTEHMRVAGCDCLSCAGFAAKGLPVTPPRNEVEAFEHSIRPLTENSRFIACATIQGDRVLSVTIRALVARGAKKEDKR